MERWTNNAASTLTTDIGAGGLTLNVQVGLGVSFPALSGSDYFWCTLEDANPPAVREIIKVTARTADTFTITRGQQGTAASAFLAGAIVSHRLTAQTLQEPATPAWARLFTIMGA